MAQLIGFLVAMYLCIYLPWKANQKEESRKRQDMYNNLNKKSVDEMAREVIKGSWGNGAERKERLTAAGYDYAAIQHRVNELLS